MKKLVFLALLIAPFISKSQIKGDTTGKIWELYDSASHSIGYTRDSSIIVWRKAGDGIVRVEGDTQKGMQLIWDKLLESERRYGRATIEKVSITKLALIFMSKYGSRVNADKEYLALYNELVKQGYILQRKR